jgi:ABC-type enterochelin transport system substrate-binding protein
LLKGKEIKKLSIENEPHEATILTNPSRVVVTNYGTAEAVGKV